MVKVLHDKRFQETQGRCLKKAWVCTTHVVLFGTAVLIQSSPCAPEQQPWQPNEALGVKRQRMIAE